MNPHRLPSGRRIPWVGIGVVLAILFAVVAFGLFKRKGSRKPPPIPDEVSERLNEVHVRYC